MRGSGRDARALAKLLKVARARMEAASRRLAELRRELQEAEASLRMLVAAVVDEEAEARAAEVVGLAQLAGFLAGAAQKRRALLQTKARLAAQIEAAEIDLAEAAREMKKLEHLVDRLREASAAARSKNELAAQDGAALQRFVRAGRR